MSCDGVEKDVQNARIIIFNNEHKFPWYSEIRIELLQINKYLKNGIPKISAAGILHLNRKTVFNLITTIIAYVIILMQFSK